MSGPHGQRLPRHVIDLVSSDDEDEVPLRLRTPPRNNHIPLREPVPRLPDPDLLPPTDDFQDFRDANLDMYGNVNFEDFPATPGAYTADYANHDMPQGNLGPAHAPHAAGQIVIIDGEEIFIPDSPGPWTRPAPAPVPPQDHYMDEEIARSMDEQNFTVDTCLQRILIVCPEVCHEHVTKLYEEYGPEISGPSRLEKILDKLLSGDDYPKEGKGKQIPRKRKREDDEAEQARKRWEAPDREVVPVASRVKLQVVAALKAEFPEISNKQIDQALRLHKHFYQTYVALAKAMDSDEAAIRHRGRPSKNSADAATILLTLGELTLHEELQAARKRVESMKAEKSAEQKKRQMEAANLQRAIEAGETAECQACFDELPMNRQIHCNGDVAHFTCFDCATTYVKTEVGESRCRVLCTAGCGAGYARAQLYLIDDKQLLEKLEQLQQEKDIRDAGLDDLEECPFCEYKAILPPIEEDHEFRCLAPECERVSCRRCKAISHIPKSCEEHAKDNKLDSRHKIEEAMTAAMLRSCNVCKKQFIKDYGCNKMSCPSCGNLQCYVCSQTVKDYNHFDQGPHGRNVGGGSGKKCPLYDNVEERHDREVREAEAAARARVMEEDPDVTEEDLKIQVSDAVKKAAEDRIKRAGAVPGGAPAAGGLLGHIPGLRQWESDDEDDDDDDEDTDDEDVDLHRARSPPRPVEGRAGAVRPPVQPPWDRRARVDAMRLRLDAMEEIVRNGRRPALGEPIAGRGEQALLAQPPRPHTGAAQVQGFIPIYGANLPPQAPVPDPLPQAQVLPPPNGGFQFHPQHVINFPEDPFGDGDADPFGFRRRFHANLHGVQHFPQNQQANQNVNVHQQAERALEQAAREQQRAQQRAAAREQQREALERRAALQRQRAALEELRAAGDRQRQFVQNMRDRARARGLVPPLLHDPHRYHPGRGFPDAPQNG